MNSTRIHDSVFHTCIDHPEPGVAETERRGGRAEIEDGPPPGGVGALTCPAGPEALGLGPAEGDVEAAGVALGRGLAVGFEGGGTRRGPTCRRGSALASCVVAPPTMMGSARGGS